MYMYMEDLDETDNKILEVIRDNARLTYKEIGDRVGISRVAVKKRMDALQEKGVIKGYQTIIMPEKAEKGTHFFLDLSTLPDYYEEIVEYLAHSKYVRQVYSVTGECCIHVEGYAKDAKNLEVFVNSLYRTAKKGMRWLRVGTVLSTIMDIDGGVEYERYKEDQHLEE